MCWDQHLELKYPETLHHSDITAEVFRAHSNPLNISSLCKTCEEITIPKKKERKRKAAAKSRKHGSSTTVQGSDANASTDNAISAENPDHVIQLTSAVENLEQVAQFAQVASSDGNPELESNEQSAMEPIRGSAFDHALCVCVHVCAHTCFPTW